MSLRAFHVVFIIASMGLSIFGAVWGAREFFVAGNVSALFVGLTFVACGILLVRYASKAFTKLKELP